MRSLAVLLDLSGTLHVGDEAVAGAVEALRRLRRMDGVRLRFVTNTTKQCSRDLLGQLRRAGFDDVQPDELFTSLTAARRLVDERRLRPLLLLEPGALEDFAGSPEVRTDSPNAVVVGLAPSHFHYDKLTEAFRLLKDGAQLIAIHKSRYYQTLDGLCLGPGPFVQALEYAADVTATVVGKPHAGFFEAALRTMDATAADALMVGDDARDDVGGAQAAGLRGVLVRTGKYRPGDERLVQRGGPFRVLDSFADLPDLVQSLLHPTE